MPPPGRYSRLRCDPSWGPLLNQLPVELLGLIFEFCIDAHTNAPAPLSFIQVCSHWRHVAFGTPRLWTSLNIGPTLHHKFNISVVIPYWLRHSYDLPLAISLDLTTTKSTRRSYAYLAKLIPFIDSIYANFYRCRSLDIRIPESPSIAAQNLSELMRTGVHMPILAELSLSTGHETNFGAINAPNLQRLTTDHGSFQAVAFTARSSSLRQATLHRVRTRCIIHHMATQLEAFSMLRVLDLHIYDEDAFGLVDRPPVTLKRVSSLTVRYTSKMHAPMIHLLRCFDLPSLHSLHVSSLRRVRGIGPPLRYPEYLAGVTELTLEEVSISTADRSFITSFTALESLELKDECEFLDLFLRALIPPPSHSNSPTNIPLPFLQHLAITAGKDDFSSELLELANRYALGKNGSSLCSILVEMEHEIEGFPIEEMETLGIYVIRYVFLHFSRHTNDFELQL